MQLALSPSLVQPLQELARARGVDPQRLLDEAVQQFVEAAAITDVTPDEIAQTQETMLGEIDPIARVANLDNIATIPRQRLVRRMGQLGVEKTREISAAAKFALDLE